MESLAKLIEDIKKIQEYRKKLLEELQDIENESLIRQAQFIAEYGAKCGN